MVEKRASGEPATGEPTGAGPQAPQRIRALLGLRELILTGAFEPGERLSEIPLGERLGVSRTPLRLAMSALEHEGLLESKGSGGFVVREFTLTDAADAIELRGILEGTAARWAAERVRTGPRVEELRGCVDDLDELVHGDPDRDPRETFPTYVELNARFHDTLAGLVDSRMLARAIGHAVAVPFASPHAFVRIQAHLPRARRVLTVAQEQHRAILEAIEAGEGARAEAVAREHALVARGNLEAAVRAGPPLTRVPGGALLRLPTTPDESDTDEPGTDESHTDSEGAT